MKMVATFATSFVLATVIFVPVELSVAQYLLLLDAVLSLLLFGYGRRENWLLFRSAFAAATGCSAAFAMAKVAAGYWLCRPTKVEMALLAVATAEAILVFFCLKRKPMPRTEQQRMHAERQYDLERIQAYIQDFEVVGINAEWGAGKSFLMEQLKADEKIKGQYEIIQIDLLTCNLDAVELVIVEELGRLFQKYRLHPRHARQLKRLLGKNEWTDLVSGMLIEDAESLASAFESFRQELGMLKKKVLLIFEDVDRIPSEDTMRKIFAISEKLSGERLRVIFQYDVQELEGKNLDRDYLEKYIPYTVNLTDIPYPRLVEYLWEELGMDECPLDMDEVRKVALNVPGIHAVKSILGADIHADLDFARPATTRRVRIFLLELKHILLENQELGAKGNAETTMRALFLKHFLNEIYEEVRVGVSLFDSLPLVDDGEKVVLPAFLERYKKPEGEEPAQSKMRLNKVLDVINEPNNRYRWLALFLLGYEMKTGSEVSSLDETAAEPICDLKAKEKNQKIDRIVWNVKANGTSEITNMENALRKLREEVLPLTGEERDKAWRKYSDDMFHRRLNKDNSTIFWMFWDPFLPLFRAMAVLGADEAQWNAFLDFYFSQYQKGKKDKTISTDLIDNSNYSSMGYKSIFLRVIRFFNSLVVVGNLNRDAAYCAFIKNYMGNIAALGYTRYMEPEEFELSDKKEDFTVCAARLFESLREELKKRQNMQTLSYVREEYDTLIEFVDKNIEMVRCDEYLPERGPSVKVVETCTRYVHEDEMDRLRKIRKECPETYELELQQSYMAGKIYLRELEVLQREQV